MIPPSASPSDRRTSPRRAIRVPIEAAALGPGTTLDISATGVLFEIDRMIVPEQPLRLQFALCGSDVLLRCEGRVVRSAVRGEKMLLAVTIEQMEVLPIPPEVCQHDDPLHCNHALAARPSSLRRASASTLH